VSGWDLRLAGAAVGCWLATLAVLHTGLGWGLAVATAATAAIVGYRAGRHRAGRVVVAGLIGASLGGAVTGFALTVRDAPAIAALARAHSSVRVQLSVRDDPRLVGRGAVLVPATLRSATPVDGKPVRGRVRVLVLSADRAWLALLPGQRVTATGRLSPPRGGDLTAAVLSTSGGPTDVGRPSVWQRLAGRLRAGLQQACRSVGGEAGGLLPGLVVGDVSAVSPAVTADFTTTGMTHLVAVSGSNVAFILGIALAGARWARAGPRAAVVVAGAVLLGFVILVRPSPSVLRAAAMGSIGLLALGSGRSRAAVPALCGTVIAVLAWDPALGSDPGFALSTSATAGLLFLAPGWRLALARRLPRGLADAIAVPAAAQAACMPVIAGLSGTVSLVAIPVNLLAVPAVAPATAVGVAAALASAVLPGLADILAWFGCWPARWLIWLAHTGARIDGATVGWPSGIAGGLLLAVLTALALVIGYSPLRRLRLGVAVLAAAVAIGSLPIRVLASGWPPPGWIMVVCDVGQGDALVLAAGPGRAVVVDTGPDPAAVDACLDRLAIDSVPLLVISHFHADHVNGVAGVFDGRTVGLIVVPAYDEPAAGYHTVLAAAAAHSIAVSVAAAWPRWTVGPLTGTLIGPAGLLTGTRSDPNNNSLELRVDTAGLSILLLGDAETEEQQALLRSVTPDVLRTTVLKVAHHGSAYQEPALLDMVDPALALISVGVDNDYGHPNAGIVDRLTRNGARVLRTDRQGDLAVVWSGRSLACAVRGKPPGS
jgi:competence protein ComEC